METAPIRDGATSAADQTASGLKEIRARVLRLGAAPAGGAPPPPWPTTEIDSDKAEFLRAFEDPALGHHMEAARRRLAQHEQALLRLPKLEALRRRYLGLMGGLSAFLRDITVWSAATQAQLGAEPAEKLRAQLLERMEAQGAAAEQVETLGRLAQAEAGMEASHAAAVELLAAARQRLFGLRSEIEEIVDGSLSLVEAHDEDRRRLREYLMLASRTAAVRETAAPGGTLGERLVTSPALPEKSGLTAEEGRAPAGAE